MSIRKRKSDEPDSFFTKAIELIRGARQQVVRQTNSLMVFTYFHLGKLIVEEEQSGKSKAPYGEEIIKQLSKVLTMQFGKGFSPRNLASIRLFYLQYHSKLQSPILQTLSAKSSGVQKLQTLSAKSEKQTQTSFPEIFPLSWSHYVTLLGVKNDDERSFYEIESIQNNWSVRELKRQYPSSLFERLALSNDKRKVKQLAGKGQLVEQPEDESNKLATNVLSKHSQNQKNGRSTAKKQKALRFCEALE